MVNRIAAIVFVLQLCQGAAGGAEPAHGKVEFNRDIRPILSDNCFFCHGPDEHHREGGLRLDHFESAMGKGDSGETAIVPGQPDLSELMRRILSNDEDERMPNVNSGKELSEDQISLFQRWIEQGAVWQEHWAYVSPTSFISRDADDNPKAGWIDHLVGSRLQSHGFELAEEADRVTLIRRLHFDLIGLPPAPDDVDQFVNDKDPEAYERLVDRLMASKHFGERMAMYWLDLVRYADTVGYHGDQDH
ncbi:MAG: DUF1549 domain-containing protein, partial [Planctomycetales bacterium]